MALYITLKFQQKWRFWHLPLSEDYYPCNVPKKMSTSVFSDPLDIKRISMWPSETMTNTFYDDSDRRFDYFCHWMLMHGVSWNPLTPHCVVVGEYRSIKIIGNVAGCNHWEFVHSLRSVVGSFELVCERINQSRSERSVHISKVYTRLPRLKIWMPRCVHGCVICCVCWLCGWCIGQYLHKNNPPKFIIGELGKYNGGPLV